VVPGGGAAYLACLPALRQLADSLAGDPSSASGQAVALGVRVLMRALEAPTAWIVRNAGQDHRAILATLRESPPGYGYDAVAERIVDMAAAGILDPLKVVRTALETGASAGLMALTTDALVLTAKKDPAINP
jgi:chaperonin GroEL